MPVGVGGICVTIMWPADEAVKAWSPDGQPHDDWDDDVQLLETAASSPYATQQRNSRLRLHPMLSTKDNLLDCTKLGLHPACSSQ